MVRSPLKCEYFLVKSVSRNRKKRYNNKSTHDSVLPVDPEGSCEELGVSRQVLVVVGLAEQVLELPVEGGPVSVVDLQKERERHF